MAEPLKQETVSAEEQGLALVNEARSLVITNDSALTLADEARSLTITNDAELERAEDFLNGRLIPTGDEVKGSIGLIVAKLHAAWKEAVAQRDRYLDPIEEAKVIIKAAIAAYKRKQVEDQKLELERRQLEAQKRAEEEALAKALVLERQGRTAEAEKVLEAPRAVIVMAPPAVSKSGGSGLRQNWSAQVTDFAALVKAAADNPAYLGLLVANEAALNAMARASKENLSIPGVVAVATDTVAAKRRA